MSENCFKTTFQFFQASAATTMTKQVLEQTKRRVKSQKHRNRTKTCWHRCRRQRLRPGFEARTSAAWSAAAAAAAASAKSFPTTARGSGSRTWAALSRTCGGCFRRTLPTKSWARARSWSWPSSTSGCCKEFSTGKSKTRSSFSNSSSLSWIGENSLVHFLTITGNRGVRNE